MAAFEGPDCDAASDAGVPPLAPPAWTVGKNGELSMVVFEGRDCAAAPDAGVLPLAPPAWTAEKIVN
jgi:hypothetical protein